MPPSFFMSGISKGLAKGLFLYKPVEAYGNKNAEFSLIYLILYAPMETYGNPDNSTSPAPYKLPIWPCK